MGERKGHDTVSAAAQRTERQRELVVNWQNFQQGIQDREKALKALQREVEVINCSADKAVDDSEKIFTELIHLMEKRRPEVKPYIRSQQRTELIHVKEHQEWLKQEISELKRKDAALEQLSQTDDHNQFLQSCPLLWLLRDSIDSNSSNICSLKCFREVTAAVLACRHSDSMTNLGSCIVSKTLTAFITTVSKLLSQVLSPLLESGCSWITVQVFCPSIASLKWWLSSTESRPHSLSLSMRILVFVLESLLSSVNSNRQQ